MAKSGRKDSINFFIGGDDEEKDPTLKETINDIYLLSNPQSRALTDSSICCDNDTKKSTSLSKAEVSSRRQKSGASVPTNANPLNASKEEELPEDIDNVMVAKSYIKSPDIACHPRRYVLNNSSKIPLIVKRNQSGIEYLWKEVMVVT